MRVTINNQTLPYANTAKHPGMILDTKHGPKKGNLWNDKRDWMEEILLYHSAVSFY